MIAPATLVRLLLGTSAACVWIDASAQIATDGTLGAQAALTGPHYAIGAGLGRQIGRNLFHSFSAFNLSAGQSATFSGPASVANVISRVTGGSPSSIDGSIRSTIAGANLFLVNPKGIAFGPNARLDLTGSFHAATADYIRLGGGGRFDAIDPGRDVLTAAPPEAFGFLGASPAGISVDGSNLSVRNESADGVLSVREGAGISLVGGPVTLREAAIETVAGDVRLAGVAGAAEVALNASATGLAGAQLAPIMVERTVLSSSSGAAAAGRIVIRGGAVQLIESSVFANNAAAADAPPVEIAGSGEVLVRSSSLASAASGPGGGAELRISGEHVRIDGRTQLATDTVGEGKGGGITVSATARLDLFDAGDDPDAFTTLWTTTLGSAPGGSLRLEAPTIRIDGAIVLSEVGGSGPGGSILVKGSDVSVKQAGFVYSYVDADAAGRSGDIRLEAGRRIDIGGLDASGSFISAVVSETYGSGDAGNLHFSAPRIEVTGGLVLSGAVGSGNAGSLLFKGDVIRFAGGNGWSTQVESGSSFPHTGNGGNVVIQAKEKFELDGNGFRDDWTRLAATTQGEGRGGDILIEAPAVTIDRATVFARTRFSTGAPGNIRIDADTVTLRNEGGIGTHTEGPADGASVTITTRVLDAADTSSIDSGALSSGNAGKVTLRAERARFTGASGITANSAGSGNAGDIVVDISESLEIVERSVGTYQDLGGGGPRGSPVWPGGFSISASGSGNAGSLHLRAPTIVLDDGRIRSTAQAAGDGGRVTIEAGSLVMRNGAQIDAKSAPGSTGDAGSIDVRVAGRFEISGHGPIDGAFSGLYAQTQGGGRGGSIDVRADTLSVDRGVIRSSTSGAGSAGAIRIDAGDVVLASGGSIDAGTTERGTGEGGSIRISAARSLRVSGVDGNPAVPVTPPAGILVAPSTLGRDQGAVASSIASNTAGSGAGGNVTLLSPRITVADGAHVSANSSGAGTAGNIFVDARPGWIWVSGAAITTQADHSDGGNITVLAGNRLHVRGGEISASVGGGSGSGGNVFIDPTFVILESARIAANAFGGAGGNIRIAAGYFLASPDTRLEASSQLGVAGTVQVAATQSDVVSTLPALPAEFLDASGLLREACTPRAAGASRLVNVGRGGVTLASSGYAASRYFADGATPEPTQPRHTPDRHETQHPRRTLQANAGTVLLAGVCRS